MIDRDGDLIVVDGATTVECFAVSGDGEYEFVVAEDAPARIPAYQTWSYQSAVDSD